MVRHESSIASHLALMLMILLVAEDEAVAARIQAKNGLESYTYNMRNSLTKLKSAVDDAIAWLDASQEASKEEYEERQKELEGIANPIMQKLYISAGGVGGFPGASEEGPGVDYTLKAGIYKNGVSSTGPKLMPRTWGWWR